MKLLIYLLFALLVVSRAAADAVEANGDDNKDDNPDGDGDDKNGDGKEDEDHEEYVATQ